MKKFLTILVFFLMMTACQSKEHIPDLEVEMLDNIQLQEVGRIDLKGESVITDFVGYGDTLILSDRQHNEVMFIDYDGKVKDTINKENLQLEHFDPTCLSISGNTLYIADSLNRQIIRFDLVLQTFDIIEIEDLKDVPIHSLLSVAEFNDRIYLSLLVNHDKYNSLYEVSQDGKLTSVLHPFMGYLNVTGNQLIASNAFVFEQQGQNFNINNQDAAIYWIDSKQTITRYNLESMFTPGKMYQLGENLISFSNGLAAIVKIDVKHLRAKVIYSFSYTEAQRVDTGVLYVDPSNNVFLVDNVKNQLIKLVHYEGQNLNEY